MLWPDMRGMCLPPPLPLQLLSNKDQTGESLFSLAVMSEYSYATETNKMHTLQINTLIQFFNF